MHENDSLVFSNTTGGSIIVTGSRNTNANLQENNVTDQLSSTIFQPLAVSSFMNPREETIKQVTATFPAKLQKLESKVKDISFVCATEKENFERLSNAIF